MAASTAIRAPHYWSSPGRCGRPRRRADSAVSVWWAELEDAARRLLRVTGPAPAERICPDSQHFLQIDRHCAVPPVGAQPAPAAGTTCSTRAGSGRITRPAAFLHVAACRQPPQYDTNGSSGRKVNDVEERNPGRVARRGTLATEPTRCHTARDRGDRRQRAPDRRARQEEAIKEVGRRKRAMSEEQRRAVAERMRKYWASRREARAQEEAAQE